MPAEEIISGEPSDALKSAQALGILYQFRYGSERFFHLIREARSKLSKLNIGSSDIELLKSELGLFSSFNGEIVPLDFPIPYALDYNVDTFQFTYREEMGLESPSVVLSKFKVFTINPDGNVIKICLSVDHPVCTTKASKKWQPAYWSERYKEVFHWQLERSLSF